MDEPCTVGLRIALEDGVSAGLSLIGEQLQAARTALADAERFIGARGKPNRSPQANVAGPVPPRAHVQPPATVRDAPVAVTPDRPRPYPSAGAPMPALSPGPSGRMRMARSDDGPMVGAARVTPAQSPALTPRPTAPAEPTSPGVPSPMPPRGTMQQAPRTASDAIRQAPRLVQVGLAVPFRPQEPATSARAPDQPQLQTAPPPPSAGMSRQPRPDGTPSPRPAWSSGGARETAVVAQAPAARAVWMPGPDRSAGARAPVQPAQGVQPFAQPSSTAPASASFAPASAAAPSGGPQEGDVYLDGARLGRWISAHLAREAGRPPSGGTAFDPRMGIAWPGSLQGN